MTGETEYGDGEWCRGCNDFVKPPLDKHFVKVHAKAVAAEVEADAPADSDEHLVAPL